MQSQVAQAHAWAEASNSQIDVVWLLRNMFRQLPSCDMPGSGVLPNGWLDGELVAGSLRSLGRQNWSSLMGYSGADSLQEITWEEFFEKFDEQGLALLVQDKTARGQKSNFNKIIARETAALAEQGGRGSARRKRA